MSITVRKGEISDVSAIVGFQLEMAKETEDLMLNHEVVTHGVTAVMNDPSKGEYFVAVSEERIIGSLMLTYEWSDWRNGQVLWIQSVYVLPDFRGGGVFKQLYQHIKDRVENNESLMGIRLYVDNSNTKAQQVYDRLGMNGDHYSVFEWMQEH